MNSQLYSVSKVFTERLLRIPDYQRGYAWTEKQLKDYWNDLNQLEDEKNHYFGVLTLETVPDQNLSNWMEDQWIIKHKSYEPFYIVDGQQRLTTTVILIQAITERIPDGESLNYTTRDEIRKKFIFESKDGGISRSYVFGYEKDNPSYEYLKTVIFREPSENAFQLQETIYTHNLLNAKQFFDDRLKELPFNQIERIYQKVTQHFMFNVYAISEDIDTYVAFETMNNRGKPLSHLELLKNRLIYLSTKFDTDTEEKGKLRHIINESWKSIYYFLGKNKDNPLDDDVFLQHHFILYFGDEVFSSENFSRPSFFMRYVRYLDVYKDYLLEKKFNPKRIWNKESKEPTLTLNELYDYVTDLKNSVEIWYQLLNPSDSRLTADEIRWLTKLNRLEAIKFVSLLLIVFKKIDNESIRVRLLQTIERCEFISLFYGFHFPSRSENLYLELARKFERGEVTIDKVISTIEETAASIIKDPEANKSRVKDLRKNGFYRWRGLAYFLFEYETYLQSKSKAYRDKIDWEVLSSHHAEYPTVYFSTLEDFDSIESEDKRDYYTIEHIYPQRPRKQCWTELFQSYSETQRSALRHSLGNLLPLSKPKNSSFQNKCFQDKKGNATNKVGFSYGSYSENEVAHSENWTPISIMERGLRLLEFMQERWNLNLGTVEDQLHILHVEFVPEIEKIPLPTLKAKSKKPKGSK